MDEAISQIVTLNNFFRNQAILPTRELMFGRKTTKEKSVFMSPAFEKASPGWTSQIWALKSCYCLRYIQADPKHGNFD